MKILIVSQYFWPEEFRINDLAAGLMQRGHSVTVLTGKPNYPDGRVFAGHSPFRPCRGRHEGVDICRVPLLPRGNGGGFRLALNYLSFALMACIVGPVLARGDYDAVIVFEPSPITVGLPGRLFSALKKAPMYLWVQDLWPDTLVATGAIRTRWMLFLVELFVRFVYRGCSRILIQSQAFRESVEQVGGDPNRILYFPNTAESVYRLIDVSAAAEEDGRLPRGFRVVFAGNIGAAQDFPTILSAAEKLAGLPQIQFIIIGDGRYRNWLKKEVNKRGLAATICLIDRQPIEKMPLFFSVSDVLLVTLRKDPVFALTIPSKVQSYLACGRPIVGALNGEGARIIGESGAGLCAPAGDAEALATAIRRIFQMSTSERIEMGKRGSEYYAVHFERELLLDKLEGWLQEHQKTQVCES